MKKYLNGVAYNLAKIDWSVAGFVTWEFESRVASTDFSEQRRENDFTNFLGAVCVRHKLHRRNLAYYWKTEWGDSGRGHYHFLIARRGTQNVKSPILATSLKELWLPNGHSKIEPFDKSKHLQSVIYNSKTEFDTSGHSRFHTEFFSPALNTMLFRLKDSAPAIPVDSFAA
jgi:hypothetical protein